MADGFEKYLMGLVVKYANSRAGREEIKKEYGIDLGKEKLTVSNGSTKKGLTEKDFIRYGQLMKITLYLHIAPLIKSITLDDIVVGRPTKDKNGEWSLTISFRDGSLHRDSLDDNDYPEGISNIVLLFAKGYHAQNYVYGLWNNTGRLNTHWSEWKDVRSRKDRSGNDFLIQAVDEFNTKYNTEGIVKAELLGRYKEDSENPV